MTGIGVTNVLVFLIFWLVPIVLIAKSDRTQGGEKLAWILLIIFVSWLAWIFYLLLAPIKQSGSGNNIH